MGIFDQVVDMNLISTSSSLVQVLEPYYKTLGYIISVPCCAPIQVFSSRFRSRKYHITEMHTEIETHRGEMLLVISPHLRVYHSLNIEAEGV